MVVTSELITSIKPPPSSIDGDGDGDGDMVVPLVIVEPFYTGSHKQLVDLLSIELSLDKKCILTLPGKKWPWRLRGSSVHFAAVIPRCSTLFASSMLNLSEVLALRPDLITTRKVIYFHENQLTYPRQAYRSDASTSNAATTDDCDNVTRPVKSRVISEEKLLRQRDFALGWAQIMSAMVADAVVFNSAYNRNAFLDSIDSFVNAIPDCRPKGLAELIRPKTSVLYFPLRLPPSTSIRSDWRQFNDHVSPLHIVWPHRWEHDKNPDDFFAALERLEACDSSYVVSVIGESGPDVPDVFIKARTRLSAAGRIRQWGYVESRKEYLKLLTSADIVVSTAIHEFFGVAILEAVAYGCFPLLPNRLVYPELYPSHCLYNTVAQLAKKLSTFMRYPNRVTKQHLELNLHAVARRYTVDMLLPQYKKLFNNTTIESIDK